MLLNARFKTFIVSELLRENQQAGEKMSPTTQIRKYPLSPKRLMWN